MGSDEVKVEREGRVVVVTIDRPLDQNRLTCEVFAAPEDLVRGLAADEGAHVLVITGGGSEFFSMDVEPGHGGRRGGPSRGTRAPLHRALSDAAA